MTEAVTDLSSDLMTSILLSPHLQEAEQQLRLIIAVEEHLSLLTGTAVSCIKLYLWS